MLSSVFRATLAHTLATMAHTLTLPGHPGPALVHILATVAHTLTTMAHILARTLEKQVPEFDFLT